MSNQRELDRIVRSWLREDADEDAEFVLARVFDQLDATPQRSAGWLARRFTFMNSSTFRYGLAAAAVIVVAVVGIYLARGDGGAGGVAPSASPSPTAEPTAEPTTEATPAGLFPPSGPLEAGVRHPMTLSGVRLSFEVPSDAWASDGVFSITAGSVSFGTGARFIMWTDAPDNVYSDPCSQTPLNPPAGPSAAELAAAVAAVPGTDLVEGPTEITVGGRPAQYVALATREDASCQASEFYLWYDDAIGGRWPDSLQSTIQTWIIDAGDAIVWIGVETHDAAPAKIVDEVQQLVDSIEFE